MFKPVKMTKLRVFCLKAVAPDVIKALHNMSALHVTDSALPELERSGPLSSYDEIAKRLVEIRTIKETLGKAGKLPKKVQSYEDPLAAADELIEKSENVLALASERETLAKELDANISAQKTLAEIEGLGIDFSELTADSLHFTILRVTKEKEKMAREILLATKNCVFSSSS